MSGKAFVGATMVGGIVSFLIGYLIWGMLFADFFANNAGTATGVMREPLNLPIVFVGTLFGAVLLTFIIGTWSKASDAGAGAKIGALVGLLVSLNIGLIQLGATNLHTTTSALVDPILSAVHGGIVGAVIAVVGARMGGAAAA